MPVKKKRAIEIIRSFQKSKVIVLGDIMLDRYLWGNVERISPEAPVPVVHVTKETNNLGGAANVAANVFALGASPLLIGVIGDDNYAGDFKRHLKSNNLSIAGLVVDFNRPTTVKTRIVAHGQQVVRVDREEAKEIGKELVEKLLAKVKKRLKRTDGIIISDYGKGAITYDLLSELIPLARSEGKFIAVDPKDVHFRNYTDVSVITPNHHEAGFISGKRITNESILKKVGWDLLQTLNLGSLLITRGDKGMALFEKDGELTEIPAVAKTVYDVTGAGDTVIATLTVARTAGASMKEAAYLANVAAGFAVAQFGTARVTKDELIREFDDKA